MKLATLCYLKRDGKTLMLHRVKRENDMHEGKWNGLGGKFEPGETPEECAIREIKEESGLDVDELELKGVLTFPEFSKNEDWYVFVFTATSFSGEMIESPEGHLEWIPNENLTDLPLWGGDKHFLEWMDTNRFFSAKFIYKNKKLLDFSVNFY